MQIKINRYVKLVLKIVISLGALYFVFTKQPIHDIFVLYKRSNFFYISVAIILFAISKTIAAFRLNKLFTCIDITLPHKVNLKLYLLGMFYNLFLPGGIGGDGYKIYFLNKKFEVKAKRIFWAIVFDRLNGMLALFCLAVVLLSFIPFQLFSFDHRYYIWTAFPLSIIVFYFILNKYHMHFIPAFWKINMQSFMVQLAQTVCAFFILMAFGNDSEFFKYLVLFLISSIVAALPITIGGIGSREIVFLYGSQLLGLEKEMSLALSLMFYLITAFVSFFGIYYSIKTSALQFQPKEK